MQKDDFWSIDKLIPRIHTSSSFSQNKSARGVPISELECETNKRQFGERFVPKKSRCILSYRLSDEVLPANDLILENDKYQGENLPFVSCGTFSPTLISLTEGQRSYFFYFLRNIEKRTKIQISYPYLQLFLCRMIRLPQWTKKDLDTLLWVWETYRGEFPLCDKLFCDTVSDYCFYRKITPSYRDLSPILTKEDMTARPFLLCPFLFDYLFASDHKLTTVEMNFVLRCVTLQSYRKSKAYRCNKTFAAASESAVKKAFDLGLFNREDLNTNLFRIQIPSQVKTKRRLFSGLPQGEIPNIEIDLDHIPFLHDENIRSRCDELIRYLENRLRKILKIKNSLSRIHISPEHRAFLEGILLEYEVLAPKEDFTPPSEGENKPIATPREMDVDFDLAARIEEDSWSITQTLTESYTNKGEESILLGEEKADEAFDEIYSNQLKEIEKAAPIGEGEFWEFAATLTETEDEFLRTALHHGKDAARIYSQAKGMFFDALILECNQKAQNSIGDSLMDPAGQIYSDYTDALKEVFPPLKGD